MKPKSDKEIQAVLRLDGPARFRHFIKQVVDREEAWGLWSDGWALMANNAEPLVFPLWPAREYAELSRLGDWTHYEPTPIGLDELLAEILPDLRNRGVLLGVLPTPAGRGVTLPSDELAAALRAYQQVCYG